MVTVLVTLSMTKTHFGCCSPFVMLSTDLVYFYGLICNKLKCLVSFSLRGSVTSLYYLVCFSYFV